LPGSHGPPFTGDNPALGWPLGHPRKILKGEVDGIE
jgi:hypothetical protein